MSSVTDIIICISLSENEELIQNLNNWIQEHPMTGDPVGLKTLNEAFGGRRVPQAAVYGASINYLDAFGFCRQVLKQPWRFRDEVTLLMQEEQDQGFWVWIYRGHQQLTAHCEYE